MSHLEDESTFRGRRAILVTSLLESDYRRVAALLLQFAKHIGYVDKMNANIYPDFTSSQEAVLRIHESEKKNCKRLAQRFLQRANRIQYESGRIIKRKFPRT